MKIYLVGGAVRDQLLHRPVVEHDWVVVGATVDEMLALGYKQVGRSFPVFLHPISHEEYALARTERKIGKGYTQFACSVDPTITLEEDLRRRDLTINAMAKTPDGVLIDPYGGAVDLKNKVLRHVSEAFAEDPVRVLRVARFAAKFGDFTVHPSTLQLMRKILEDGELDALIAERVWQEFARALAEPHPERFFMVLNECGALRKLFPEIAMLIQTKELSQERGKGKDIKDIYGLLKTAAAVSSKPDIRFAVLVSSLDVGMVNSICRRYRIPRQYTDAVKIVLVHKGVYDQYSAMYSRYSRECGHSDYTDKTDREKTGLPMATLLLSLFEALDAFRRPSRLEKLIVICEIIHQWCCGGENYAKVDSGEMQKGHHLDHAQDAALHFLRSYHVELLWHVYRVAKSAVNVQELIAAGMQGDQLKSEIRKRRLGAIASALYVHVSASSDRV
jgi:tRNA nucleotidyltransferase (CCA-adding enzyme)